MQRQGVTLDDLDSWVDCQGDGCDAAIDTAEVGHPENAGWLRETEPARGYYDSADVTNLCPRCRIEYETDQQTLDEIKA
jgi:hypothetical protein